ncbi:MAG TPA: inositol monophosphatase family protein [Candidatus Nanopelagicaceae bacterium]|jgi:myo-inositol-1(or 4)-monophosphatase
MANKVLASELLGLALEIAQRAGELLMQRPLTFEVTSKSVAIDIATQMDHDSERLIVNSLLAARPDDGIIGEEGSARDTSSGITWVIDPVDGTVNYLYGLPGWSVSIAAKDDDGILVGVVHAPTIGSTWTATRGGGAFFNGNSIRCNEPVSLDRALIGTGFVYDVSMRAHQGKVVSNLLPLVRDIRRMGSAAVDICNVAMGAYDGYFEIGLKEWDLAAAHLIACESGALISTDAGDLTCCAGPSLYPVLVQVLEAGR